MALGDQSKENLLHISWCDSRCVPVLNASNILDYFTERTNPFYHKDCNNEFLKMQQNTRIEGLHELQSFSQYHPSRGYWWQTPKQNQDTSETQKTNNEKKGTLKDEVASVFQRRRVDLLLNDLAQKFPYKLPIQQQTQQAVTGQETQTHPPSSQNAESVKTDS
ncbi:Mediator of RNA polymerase II transcription subunit 6 [Armadillidium nasatum]|uniref:Mediator of RNA polymerase II transcription subunit 6 n=1 Tax=Armadillidium nasatum TaxID=96803 RepID=A0A5N5SL82_9CRUS|nr:Mediator of RNA polymerase II transcription subunit 6 [Armadillidium nasatum]